MAGTVVCLDTSVLIEFYRNKAAKQAIGIYQRLKQKNKLIDVPDIMIAGTALQHNMPLATLNRKHFERITGLEIITKT